MPLDTEALAADLDAAEPPIDFEDDPWREGRTTKATDLLILATAAATGRELHTLDHAQAALAAALGLAVVAP
jgi:predicted nuclease of predicted toxin-antitoxin system